MAKKFITILVEDESIMSSHEKLDQRQALSILDDLPPSMARGILDLQALADLVGGIEYTREKYAVFAKMAALLAPLGVDEKALRALADHAPRTPAPLDDFDPRSTAESIIEEIDMAREYGEGAHSVADFLERDCEDLVLAYANQVRAALGDAGYDPDWTAADDPQVLAARGEGREAA